MLALNFDSATFNCLGAEDAASKCESIICVLWDSTLLRFYDVAKNYAVKKRRIDGSTPCFYCDFIWSSKKDLNHCLSLPEAKLQDYSSTQTC